MAWLSNTEISFLSPCLLLSFVIHTHTHTYLAENGVLPTPCHVSGFSFMKIYSCVKWKDAFTMECFTLGCTASLWLLYSLAILLLGVGCSKVLKTNLRCGHPSLCFSLLCTYICIGRKLHCGRTDPHVKLNAKQAGPVWRGSPLQWPWEEESSRGLQHPTIPCTGNCEWEESSTDSAQFLEWAFLSSDCRAWYLHLIVNQG